ncbi:MAG TPA: DUF6298 domain-containing protein [Opitutaceae bacterium]|nr:DUF6298 domain-containing protein [Opitutaceae bacterium]
MPRPASLRPSRHRALFFLSYLALLAVALAQQRPAISIRQDADGKLAYTADTAGNNVIDFSAAGYAGGGEAIPLVPAKITVAPTGRRDRERIQAALDLVAALPAGADGFRGAVLLAPGRFTIEGTLRLNASGVVLRGSGQDETGTVLVAAGNSRRTLIEIGGGGERVEVADTRTPIADAFVPVGARKISIDDAAGFPVGSRVVIRRPSTAAWIVQIGMNAFSGWRPENRITWTPGSRDIAWERTVTATDGHTLTLDAPLTTAIDRQLGDGTIARCEFPGRIDHVGLENLRCVSEFDRAFPQDEEHAWVCVALDKVENAWVRQLTAQHFVSYVVNAQADSKSLTIEDCVALDPVSEIAAYRRRVFSIAGQLTLVQRCRSEHGLRDFTTGFAAAGPNVFLQCRATGALDASGPVESWASGVLYDNVVIRGNALRFVNRGANGQGAGWTAANSILWNCESTELQVQSPPGAANQAYGCKGLIVDDSLVYDSRLMPFREFVGGGATLPASLYLAQLAERKGAESVTRLARVPLSLATASARALADADVPAPPPPAAKHPLRVDQGQFTIDGQPAFTAAMGWSWFMGQMPRNLARPSGPALTRFSPGETGVGQTDRLEDVIAALPPGTAFVQHYGLWYDRRRINHNFYGSPELRADDVSAPFMEIPWARSGQGTDWNGLSKYDLTRFNPWYFQRVRDFADLADTHSRVLQYNFYFQHALQETRAHYVDFPWRPVNCLQATDLPDENPAGSAFYDISHPVRRNLHRRYIRHCLDVLKGNTNVVYGIDREYSGPLSFVQFWLDTIAEWERENGRKVFITLEVPKAEMDALLADPVRRPLITAIDFHHWNYRADGSLFAIEGGLNLAPREQLQRAAQLPSQPRAGGPMQRYRALREYRDAFPDLVLLRKTDDFPALSTAIEKTIPAAARAKTRPAPLVRNHPESAWAMAAPGSAYLLYTLSGEVIDLDLSQDNARYTVTWIDSASAEQISASAPSSVAVTGGKTLTLTPPLADSKRPWAAWLTRAPYPGATAK